MISCDERVKCLIADTMSIRQRWLVSLDALGISAIIAVMSIVR
jgi:hypothetical protein